MDKTCIVIVNYNGYKVLKDTIESLYRMSNQDFDIVVVDNASTDETDGCIVIDFPKVIYLKQGENLGFAGGSNIGIRYAIENGYSYTLLLNNDVVVHENLLGRLLELASARTIVVPKIYFYDNPNLIWYAGGEILYNKMESHNVGYGEQDVGQYDNKREVEFLNGCCVLINNDIFAKIGLLDEDYFMYFEDFDFGVRALKNGIRIMYQPEAKLWHKVSSSTGGENSKVQVYYMTRNRLLFNKKNPEVFGRKAILYSYFKNIVKYTCSLVYKRNNAYILKGYMDYKKGIKSRGNI